MYMYAYTNKIDRSLEAEQEEYLKGLERRKGKA